jgi:hypothetical protein
MYSYFVKLSLLVFIAIIAIDEASSQSVSRINSTEFLSKFFLQSDVTLQQDERYIRFPWIEQLDLRTETRDLDFDQQEYTLRLDPSSRKKRNAYNDLYNAYKRNPDLRKISYLEEDIYTAYKTWVSLYFIEKRKSIYEGLQLLYADKALLSEKKLNALEISFKDLIDIETSSTQLEVNAFDDDLMNDYFLRKYSLGEVLLDFEDIIKVEEILLSVQSMEMSLSNKDLEKYNYEQELINKEIAVEKAEGQHYFDFLQFKYRGPHDNLFEERFSIGLGTELSNPGSRKLKLEELKLKQLEIEQGYENDIEESNTVLEEIKEEIILDIKSYMNKKEASITQAKNLSIISDKVRTREGYDPEILLDIKEKTLKFSLELLDLEESIYEDYIKLLAESLNLFKKPLTNHLQSVY